MMQLTKTHLRYLLAIYELAQTSPGVSAGAVAKVLAVSKPSVTRMMGLLMEKGLLNRERYGKVFLTDTGVQVAREYRGRLQQLQGLIPRMGLLGYWTAMAIELSVKGIIFAVRIRGGRWMHTRLTEEGASSARAGAPWKHTAAHKTAQHHLIIVFFIPVIPLSILPLAWLG